MCERIMALSSLPIGKKATITELAIKGLSRRRLLDLGFIPGTQVEVLYASPCKDPVAYQIRGVVIALRKEESSKIIVKQHR